MTPTLLPCPFCNGNADFTVEERTDHPELGGHSAMCFTCGAGIGYRFACGDDPRPLLAEMWNRRAHHPTPVPAEPAALPDGFELVAVKNLGPLVDALERAARKGYMPDAMAEEWEAFDFGPAAAQSEKCTQVSDAEPAARVEAEPVAWLYQSDLDEVLPNDGWCVVHASRCDPGSDHAADVPLYAAPVTPEVPQVERLTDDLIERCRLEACDYGVLNRNAAFCFARAIERALQGAQK